MVRLNELSEAERKFHEGVSCPTFETQPWVEGPLLSQRRVAIVSTAGLHRRGDHPFTFDARDGYRIIPGDVVANDLVMTHVSANFDRAGFQHDWNVVFPVDRLRELAEEGIISSVASYCYSFMGAHDPMALEDQAHSVVDLMVKDQVNAVLLVPV
jgi:D-proline reductase (dithiol) PrdB